jgi:hypothetical protein
MGSEWGLRPLRIGPTTAEVTAIHWSPRADSGGDGTLATGGRLGLPSRDPRQHRRDGQSASRTSEQTAPNPGTSWRGALGEHGGPGDRSKASGRDRRTR